MTEFLDFVANAALVILVIALVFSTYRIWTGPSMLERLQAQHWLENRIPIASISTSQRPVDLMWK